MSVTAVERRRIVVLGIRGRVDLALPLDDTLDDAVRLSDDTLSNSASAVIGPDGYDVPRDTACEELIEGGLYTLVDLSANAERAESVRQRTAGGMPRSDHGARWWLLGVIAMVIPVAFAFAITDPLLRIGTGAVLSIGSMGCAYAWARADAALGARRVVGAVAPAFLSFAAGMLVVDPHLEAAAHLAVVSGLIAAAITVAVIAFATHEHELRAAAATSAILLVTFAAIWGITLLLQWGVPAAAALSAAIVPLGLRAMPSTLVNLPEGYFIDYKHFMSNRWTVRGAIPESPGSIRPDRIHGVVADSSARLVAGTVILSVAAAVFAPIALLRPWPADPFVTSGGIALVACLVLSLLLTPRHTSSRILRWFPRAAAGVVVLSATVHLAASLRADVLVLGAGLLFFSALVTVAVAVPISRGARSLGWSRTGDVFEWIAVALAMPAGLLFADALSLLRGMMSG